METVTAATIYKEGKITEESKAKISRLIFACYHLSTLQNNLFQEIEDLLKAGAGYRLEVKHNHKRIKSLLQQGLSLSHVWMKSDLTAIEEFCRDSDALEKIVRQWAGIKSIDKEEPHILNEIAKEAYNTAVARGKFTETTHKYHRILDIKNEVKELQSSDDHPSVHIVGYTGRQEEAADVIICTLSYLADENINIEELLQTKMEYNKMRIPRE